MIANASYIVHSVWTQAGSFFLWADRMTGGRVDAFELKQALFAWHAPSFYGTFVEVSELGDKEGIQLPAELALDYLSDPSCPVHRQLEWDSELQDLRKLAPQVRDALEQGRFMPDFAKWSKGEPGWKLELAPEARALLSPAAKEWTDRLIADRVQEQQELRQALSRLEETYERLQQDSPETETPWWRDEEDWLIAIGWKSDPRPFRTCLQLLEPEEGRGWRLRVLLQDRERASVLIAVDDRAVPIEDEAALPESWQAELDRAVGDVQQWLRILPWLRDKREPERLRREELTHEEAWEFLSQGSLRLAEAGFAVFLPAWWDRVRKLKPRMKARLRSAAGPQGDSLLGLNQLMRFDWRFAVGDIEMTEEEFQQLLQHNQRIVRFRGQWVLLDPDQIAQIREVMQRMNPNRGLSFRDVLELHLKEASAPSPEDTGEGEHDIRIEVELNDHLKQLMSQLKQLEAIPPVNVPDSFQGSLRPYQRDGVSWMLFLRRFGLGGCLADDMGLGKTIQWITYLLAVQEEEKRQEKEQGRKQASPPSLLICPTSVLGNWQKELRRFAPSLNVRLHYGPNRHKGKRFTSWAQEADLVLTSYNLAHLDEEELRSLAWNSICLDEAQNIKNAHTKQSSSIRRLEGGHRVALTGTPIENRLTELWSIFDFLNPGYLGSLREFTGKFAQAIERSSDPAALQAVQSLIRPFLLRRVKKDPAIQLDLPDKYESKTYVSLTAEQASLYENHIQQMFERLDRLTAMERRGLILSSLTKLKQLCNHPALLLKEPAPILWEDRSNKVERLLEMVSELRQEGDRCLIFTQYVDTGKMLQSILNSTLQEPVMFLHGGTPRATRELMISHFQGEPTPVLPWKQEVGKQAEEQQERCGIFLLSLKTGGTGLNLTAANHVFHFDRWWNPAVENQATDRAFRIGQTRDVQVHKFVTLGTLEEKIDEMIERKQGLSQQIVGSGESWITELSTEELQDLFTLRQEWVEA
ncbi:DEAD/DEAH box helicase [Paenibacillus sp. J2TS4]|uniref:DEAD/DEAH box helicase n=1 Tax=Paenibacillus sp. J2TS4 TaxID=2807194 RepID=UPI001B215A7A|nr:DEAD/DEAH box helicase [Paenibacillus sp. J2TS4]GIP35675.1 putative ATP-dependent helicase YwqA [Paenibacillus sp. J2TS4]